VKSAPVEPLSIFVSYRRTDRPGHAGRVRDALRRTFGNDAVFYDVATIRGGADFAVAIKQAIEKSSVVIAIIGPDWGRFGLRDRLLSRRDWVRFEIEHARQAGKPILPIVVAGAGMPRNLPASLGFLSTINAVSLRDESWDNDVDQLIERLPAFSQIPADSGWTPAAAPDSGLKRGIAIASVALVVLAAAWVMPRVWNRPPSPPDPAVVPAPPKETGTAPAPAVRQAPNRPPTTGRIHVAIPDGGGLLELNRTGLMSATRFVLTATDITDPDGDRIRYTWDFGDGSAAPPSSARVEKVYREVDKFQVKLFVNDGKLENDLLVAETDITIRSVTGTWLLSLERDPKADYPLPTQYEITLLQDKSQLSGRITPGGSNRPTVLSGNVAHPARIQFGSESAWWNDTSDAYFDLKISDGNLAIQMTNTTPNRCGPQIPCAGARAYKQ
jgi:TIR domain/PKD domain